MCLALTQPTLDWFLANLGIRLPMRSPRTVYTLECLAVFVEDPACMSQVTRILERAQAGDPQAADQLLPLVYDELRKLAASKMAQQPPGQTLQPTTLVHEAWLRLTGSERDRWNDRRHFFRAARSSHAADPD